MPFGRAEGQPGMNLRREVEVLRRRHKEPLDKGGAAIP
jgi:hypothetical protein